MSKNMKIAHFVTLSREIC